MTHEEVLTKVDWEDLRTLTRFERIIENSIAIPWLIGAVLLSFFEFYLLAVPCYAFFFLTGLRTVHNGFHNALGVNRFLTELTLYVYSFLMITSIHAVKFNHLRHHKHCLSEEDYEGKAARMTWYGAILYGPIHYFQIHWITLQKGNKQMKFSVLVEVSLFLVLIGGAVITQSSLLLFHIGFMIFAEFMMAFFAVWIVHHHTEEDPRFARTQRAWWKNWLSYSMFYHLEHHLFPAVPTIKLKKLVQRIDREIPDLEKKITF